MGTAMAFIAGMMVGGVVGIFMAALAHAAHNREDDDE